MSFPTSIEAAEYFQVAYDNLSTTLTEQFNSSDTTCYVTSTTNFPSSGWFVCDDDICSYTGKTAYSFTGVTHGVGGTTPADHTAGKVVSLTLNATAWNRVITELRAAQTKIGKDSSADTSSLDYKLSSVTSTAKAVSTAGAQTISGVKTFSDGIKAKKREATIESDDAPTPNADTTDIYTITALAENATFGAPSGTPTQGQELTYRIKDNGTSRTLAYNAVYTGSLPTRTIVGKTLYIDLIYNSTDSKWNGNFIYL